MTIESYLERIAVALEKATSGQRNLPLEALPLATTVVAEATRVVETATPTAEAPKRRGRPPKDATTTAPVGPVTGNTTTTPPAVTTETREEEPAADSFLDEPVGVVEKKEATVDEVRAVLTEIVKLKGGTQEAKNFAYKILYENGDKAQRLPGSPQDAGNPNAPGALKPEKFQAVIDAANKVLAAAK